MIRFLVRRYCHVGLSNRAAIREVISHFREGLATFKAQPRDVRRQLMCDVIAEHEEGQSLVREFRL